MQYYAKVTVIQYTVMCLSIGTPKNNKFSICSKWKINVFKCPKICANYSIIIIGLNIGTPKNINLLFGTIENSMTLRVPILKHFRVLHFNVTDSMSDTDWFYRQCYLKHL